MRDTEPDVRIEFPPSPAAASRVRRELADLPVPDAVADDVRLVVSELVTNVVRHAGTDGVVEVWACHDDVRIEVHDAHPAAPRMRRIAGPDGGFGLRVVDRLSTAWGHWARRDGKTVWAVVDGSSASVSPGY